MILADFCWLWLGAHPNQAKETTMTVFDEPYIVVDVESHRLTLQGMLSGEVITIVNTAPDSPLTQEDYPRGQLIALTDPSTALLN